MAVKINYPETPAGKRSVKYNVYGNLVGYVSGKRFWEFGIEDDKCNAATAKAWLNGETLEEAQWAILRT